MNLFDIAKLESELAELEKETTKDGFWNNQKDSEIVLNKIKNIKNKTLTYNKLEEELKNLKDLTELVELEYDKEIINEIIKNTIEVEKQVEKFEIETLFVGKYDKDNALVQGYYEFEVRNYSNKKTKYVKSKLF